jgi:hypothetical protein
MIGIRISKLAPLAALAFLAASCSRSPDQRAAQPLSPRSKSAAAQNAARCTGFNPERNLYFGDMHVHTSYSFDAYGFGTRTDPFGAYAFAQGAPAQIASPPPDPSRTVQLVRRLDFAAVTDHSEGFGEYPPGMFQGEHPARDAWEHEQMAAEAANDTSANCSFTALIAYEWTGSMSGRWWHRNVIFRNARVPELAISSLDENTPQGLWASLQAVCLNAGTGCDVISIPHNPNYSDGVMFNIPETITPEEARTRAALEPLAEIHQAKGNSECKIGVETSDPLCDFYQKFPVDCVANPGGFCSPANFVRNALRRGIQVEERIGVNPLKLGVISDSDTHNGTPGDTDEYAYQGHHGRVDGSPAMRVATTSDVAYNNSGGLVAVWSEENSRDAIFDSFRRRETYGTSGQRPKLRFFGGWGYQADLCDQPEMIRAAYQGGVPMGGDLPPMDPAAAAPAFLVSALKDPGTAEQPGTPLQHAQIVKGWIDPATGESHERIYEVAGDPDNGATVDPDTCQTSGPGFDSLCTVWRDRAFDPSQRAFYYVRLLDNPTCSIYQLDCNQIDLGQRPASCSDGSFPMTIQARAWSSPIWYQP